MDARFKVEEWGKGDKLEREIAIVDHIIVAQAAYMQRCASGRRNTSRLGRRLG